MKFHKPNLPQASVPLAPMIDVVFLLLIFFIVTWQFSRTEMDLKVSVPTSSQGANDKKRPLGEIIINIRNNGDLVVNGQILEETQLQSKLENIAKAHEDPKTGKSFQPVRLRGAGEVPYQRMVEVIDLCQKAGIWNISFATRKNKG